MGIMDEIDDSTKAVLGCFIMLVALAVVVFFPLAVLWSVYTVWNMSIELQVYDFYHWLAAFCLSGMFGGAAAGASSALNKS